MLIELDSDSLVDFTWPELTDLVATVLFVALSDVVLLSPSLDLLWLRTLFALPFVLFVPGYVAVSALFPRRCTGEDRTAPLFGPGRSDTANGTGRHAFKVRPITWKVRLALSFGLSLALVPLLGLVVGPLAGSLTLEPVLFALNAFVLWVVGVAIVRRSNLPSEQRLRIPRSRWMHGVRTTVFGGDTHLDRIVSGVLVLSVVAAAATLGFALLAPQSGETYTSVSLLTENVDGELTVSGYPDSLVWGEEEPFVVAIENSEGTETTYAVVGELQRVDTEEDSMPVTTSETVLRTQERVPAGETWTARHTVTPSLTGDHLRLAYYVYRGDPPDDPGEESAYRSLYLWIDVSESDR